MTEEEAIQYALNKSMEDMIRKTDQTEAEEEEKPIKRGSYSAKGPTTWRKTPRIEKEDPMTYMRKRRALEDNKDKPKTPQTTQKRASSLSKLLNFESNERSLGGKNR